MFWKEHKNNDDDTTTLKRATIDSTIMLSSEMVMPQMKDFESLSDKDKRERIANLILAMAYSQAVFAHVFLKTTAEEFGHQMGSLIKDTLRTIQEHRPSAAALLGMEAESKDTASGWD